MTDDFQAHLDQQADQRRANLDKAREVKQARYGALVALRERRVDPVALLEGNTEWETAVRGARIDKILLAIPRIGPTRANEILSRMQTVGSVTLKGLSWKRRQLLASYVHLVLMASGGDITPERTKGDWEPK